MFATDAWRYARYTDSYVQQYGDAVGRPQFLLYQHFGGQIQSHVARRKRVRAQTALWFPGLVVFKAVYINNMVPGGFMFKALKGLRFGVTDGDTQKVFSPMPSCVNVMPNPPTEHVWKMAMEQQN